MIFGHYAIKTDQPELLAPIVAFIDFGMGKGGFLCAYQWKGEEALSREGFRQINPARRMARKK